MRDSKRLPLSFLLLATFLLLKLDIAITKSAMSTAQMVPCLMKRHSCVMPSLKATRRSCGFLPSNYFPTSTVRIRSERLRSCYPAAAYPPTCQKLKITSLQPLSSFPCPVDVRKRTRLAATQVRERTPPVEDTIFALSSGQGRAGVAVIRISGPQAKECLAILMDSHSGHSSPPFPAPRMASLRKLYCPVGQEALDQAIVLWLPGPRSFTGEDTVELHCHGSRAVVQGVTEALLALDKGGEARVRLAEPGEFTERAFANGRMDLTEVEGLADLIAADTAAQRKQALKQMGGALRQTYEGWREELKVCLAHTEAVIDFGDDELDVDEAAYDAIRPRVRRLSEEMRRHLADGGRGEVIRAGIRVAIVGPPNAGKSTMLNTLARRPAAIVSPAAGTTRDVVEVQLDVGGLPVLVSDTAGIREAARDPVEQEGIRRAREAAGRAQLTVLVLDAAEVLGQEAFASLAGVGPFSKDAPPEDLETVLRAVGGDAGALLVLNKRDTVESEHLLEQLRRAGAGKGGTSTAAYLVSLSTGEGVEEMLAGLQARLEEVFDKDGTDDERAEAPVITRARHRVHVERCLEALTASMGEQGLGLDVAAEELRIASTELGRITGAVDVEEVLDVIFRDFCIGK